MKAGANGVRANYLLLGLLFLTVFLRRSVEGLDIGPFHDGLFGLFDDERCDLDRKAAIKRQRDKQSIAFKHCEDLIETSVNITVAPHLIDFVKKRGMYPSIKPKFDRQVELIKQCLPYAAPPVLLENILRDDGFSIQVTDLTHQPGVKGQPTAVYLPWSNQLRVVQDADVTKAQICGTLANDMFHVTTRYRNLKIHHGKSPARKDSLLMIQASYQLDQGWQSDPVMVEQLNNALQASIKRRKYFKTLFERYSKSNSPALMKQQPKAFKAFKSSIKHYVPELHREVLPLSLLGGRDPEKMREEMLQSNEPLGSLYVKDVIYYPRVELVLKGSANKDNSWQEKARAFFFDTALFEKDISNPAYRDRSQEQQAIELLSFIQQVGPVMAKLVYKPTCQFLDDYYALNDGDFCYHPQSIRME